MLLIFLIFLALLLVRGLNFKVLNFKDCVEKGYPVRESYPRQCEARGFVFTEDIGNAFEKQNLIILDTPRPNDTVEKEIVLLGKARGYWFFEATFSIQVVDSLGNVIGEGFVESLSEWMTEDFVPFSGRVILSKEPQTEAGQILLKKENPSGDPVRDDALVVPIIFKKSS